MVTYVADEFSKRELKHGTQFNLAIYRDRVDWEWVKELPFIAGSEEEARDYEGSYLLYIYDGDRDNNRKLKKSELVHRANTYIHNTPLDSFPDKARLLNERIEHLSPKKIKELLLDRVDSKDTTQILKVISIYEDNTSDERLLLYKLMDKSTIQYKKGVFYFGELMLGQTEEQVIAYMKSPDNKHIYNNLVYKAYPEIASNQHLKNVLSSDTFNLVNGLDDDGDYSDETEESEEESKPTVKKRPAKKSSSK